MGIGLAAFARDEPNLFPALYRTGAGRADLLGRYQSGLPGRLRDDAVLGLSGLFAAAALVTLIPNPGASPPARAESPAPGPLGGLAAGR